MNGDSKRETAILPVDVRKIGRVSAQPIDDDILDALRIDLDPQSPDVAHLQLAAEQLKHSDIPVAFPTETVYGLGADATRSAAVNGIYKAKNRPSDNPLIVHFSSLKQLRELLDSGRHGANSQTDGSLQNGHSIDPIPDIYKHLISKFWPGPLTIILRNPPNSPLAPEVTAGLETFGARMPRHVLALALIELSGVPIAAPSANASTKPSPTAAEHVYHDLNGCIDTIIDGGPCDVGVESTVVDGLSDPPSMLRPGGISIEQLRSCPGWENTQIGYKSVAETGSQPRAPGMKYRHYSPKAKVVLYQAGLEEPSLPDVLQMAGDQRKVGNIGTNLWNSKHKRKSTTSQRRSDNEESKGFSGMLAATKSRPNPRSLMTMKMVPQHEGGPVTIYKIDLGPNVSSVARGIFSALRELDRENVNAILVEGISEGEGETAAAVMNRLRKAAETELAP